jgi:hypothetical protein
MQSTGVIILWPDPDSIKTGEIGWKRLNLAYKLFCLETGTKVHWRLYMGWWQEQGSCAQTYFFIWLVFFFLFLVIDDDDVYSCKWTQDIVKKHCGPQCGCPLAGWWQSTVSIAPEIASSQMNSAAAPSPPPTVLVSFPSAQSVCRGNWLVDRCL